MSTAPDHLTESERRQWYAASALPEPAPGVVRDLLRRIANLRKGLLTSAITVRSNVALSCPGHGGICGAPRRRVRPCGCIEFDCGSTKTCDDFHHGDGVLLDCPTERKPPPFRSAADNEAAAASEQPSAHFRRGGAIPPGAVSPHTPESVWPDKWAAKPAPESEHPPEAYGLGGARPQRRYQPRAERKGRPVWPDADPDTR